MSNHPHDADAELQKIKILQSGVYKLWLHYSHEAAKLTKWANEPGGEDLKDQAREAQRLAARFEKALDQLNFELNELVAASYTQWKDKATELRKKLDEATKDVDEHYNTLRGIASATKTVAQVLGAIYDVLKFLAFIP